MDMLKIEYDLLKYIQDNQPISYTDLLNGFRQSHNVSLSACDNILQCLLDDRCLDTGGPVQDRHFSSFRLYPRTTQKLYQYEQERADETHQEDLQREFAKVGARAAVFGAVLGAVTGSVLTFLFALFTKIL